MVSVLSSNTIDRTLEPRLDQAKNNKIDICSFSTKHTAVMNRSKDLLARNQDNVSVVSHKSTHGLLFQ